MELAIALEPQVVSSLDQLATLLPGVLVGGIGVTVGLILKEFLFPRLFESWKSRRALQDLYRRYRDPLFLAGSELAGRLVEVCKTYPTNYLASRLLDQKVPGPRVNSADDLYFRRYKLVSSLYRLCAFLGWLELYRQDIVFLDSGRHRSNARFEQCLLLLREDIADGHLNRAEDWYEWSDYLIFREELRAAGEAMIVLEGGQRRVVMGYARFCEVYLDNADTCKKKWLDVASQFLLDPPENTAKNFRLVRFKRVLLHLVDLLTILEPKRVSKYLTDYQPLLAKDLAQDEEVS
jgi:hypothetical protein